MPDYPTNQEPTSKPVLPDEDPLLSNILRHTSSAKPSRMEPDIAEAIRPILTEEVRNRFPSAQLVSPDLDWMLWRRFRNRAMGASLGTLAAAGFVGLGAAEPSAREFAIPAAMASVVGVPPIYWTALAVRRVRAIKKLKNQLRERIEQHLTDKYMYHLERNPNTPIREDPTLRRLFEGFDPNTPIGSIPRNVVKDQIEEVANYGVRAAWKKFEQFVDAAREAGVKMGPPGHPYKGILFGDVNSKIGATVLLLASGIIPMLLLSAAAHAY